MQLVFLGEVLDGFESVEVKRQLARLLKLDEAGLQKLFSGKRVVLKRSVELAEAHRYVARLAEIGARLHIEPGGTPAAAASALPVEPASVRPVPGLAPVQAPLPVQAAPTPAPVAPPALGAVPAVVLEEQITCPNCGEIQSKRVLCRACSTNMPMGIAAKAEAAQLEREARLEARRQRLEGRSAVREAADAPSVWGLGFSGRIGRLNYAAVGMVVLVLLCLPLALLWGRPGAGRVIMAGLAWAALVVWALRLTVLRFHDCNFSGWWALVLPVPILGFLASLVLSFMPGTPGDNDYGEPPRPGSWLGFLLAVGGMIIGVGMLAAVALPAYQDYARRARAGASSSPQAAGIRLPSAAATEAFNGEYQTAPGHKVFAASSSGAWGWKAGESSLESAFREAIAQCEARREPYTAPCVPINIDGEWASRGQR